MAHRPKILLPPTTEAQPAETAELPLSSADLNDNSWMHSILRPALIALAAVCLVLAMLAFIRRIMPSLPPIYTELLAIIGALASITGSITTTWLAQPGQRSKRSAGYRFAEMVLILGTTRIAIWLTTDSFPGAEQFLLKPIESFLDGYFIVGAIVVMLAWIMSTAMTEDLLAMALQPDDLYIVRGVGDRWQDTARPVYTDRPAILRRFVARWVVGGILLVIFAAGSRYDLPESGGFLGVIRQNIDPTVVGAIIVYFLAGLVLISQGQLALLRSRWILQKVPSAPGCAAKLACLCAADHCADWHRCRAAAFGRNLLFGTNFVGNPGGDLLFPFWRLSLFPHPLSDLAFVANRGACGRDAPTATTDAHARSTRATRGRGLRYRPGLGASSFGPSPPFSWAMLPISISAARGQTLLGRDGFGPCSRCAG